MQLTTVKVPEPFALPFVEAEKIVSGHFDSMQRDPTQGIITIGGERYVLVRAMSLSVHFLECMKEMYPGMTEGEARQGGGAPPAVAGAAGGRVRPRAVGHRRAGPGAGAGGGGRLPHRLRPERPGPGCALFLLTAAPLRLADPGAEQAGGRRQPAPARHPAPQPRGARGFQPLLRAVPLSAAHRSLPLAPGLTRGGGRGL